jgi:hypothetical protein
MRRRGTALKLSRETIRELSSPELQHAAGGAVRTLEQGCLDSLSPTCGCTGYYPSLNAPCTGP